MKKIMLLLLVLYGTCNTLKAQNFLRGISKAGSAEDSFEQGCKNQERLRRSSDDNVEKSRNTNVVKIVLGTNTSLTVSQGIVASDQVLYRDVVRKYTWLEGSGSPITQEEANHLPYYFRLSMKNDAGHYHHVEAMQGRSLTVLHPLSTYILDKESDTDKKNQEWRDLLLTVGQWFFYSDITGEYVLEERAYEAKEKDAKLVYAMQPVRNDSNHVTITYTDSWGYPADMNENDRYTYGSVVYITYDKNGYDAIIDYLDGEGYRKPNTNGVDQTRCEYDDNGRPLLRTSNNCVDDYAIDNWGNCGIKYTYDDANNSYSMLCVDSNLQPMRMPNIRANEEETYIRCDVKKDRWGRKSEAVILTTEGEKDATLSGIHRITYTYKADGTQQKHYYDISGKKITIK